MSRAVMSPDLEFRLLMELCRLIDRSRLLLDSDRSAVVSADMRVLDAARRDLNELLNPDENQSGEK